MNKKFSTLMAAALLAGSLPVVAQDTIWVKVNSAQLVNGAKYRITDTRNYPLVDGTATVSSGKMSWAEPAPILDKNHADPDSIWTLIKTDKGFTLKSSETSNPIYLVGDANGAAAQMYTNINKEEAYANLILNEDGTLSDATNKGLAHSYSGLYFSEADSAAATKFSFEMLVQNPSNMADSPITALPEKSTTMHVIFEGKYVGISTDTKALGCGLTSVESLPEGNADNYLWLYEDGALKNIANDKYLTVSDNGDLVLSDKAVVVSFVNNILSVNGNGAVASLLNSSTPLPFNGPKFTAVSENAAIVLYGADGKVYSADSKFEAYYDAQNSAKTVWTLTPVQVENGEYEIRLVNAEYTKLTKNPYLTVNGKWVVVKEITWNAADGEFNYNGGYSTLMAGSQFVTITSTGLDVTSQINQAYTFGFGQIQVAYITAGELTSRYGNHFTLKITYKNEYQKDVDVTGVFSGNLRPCIVSYVNGQATYDYDIKGQTSFMLVNEKGNIIAIDKKQPLLGGKDEYGYPFVEPITPKQYALDVTNDKTDYAVWFDMEYTPGQAEGDVRTINNINLEGLRVGLQKNSKGEIELVAANAGYLLDKDITIALNAGSVVNPKAWLTQATYYTVKSINKETKTTSYGRYPGKVLGLTEYGTRVDFVDAENIDLNQPEGQFSIRYDEDNARYIFTNRETGDQYTEIEEANLYKIDATTFAYVHGEAWTTPDTLSIEPVSTYASSDGFKRFSPAELNANTYTVSMKLFNGDLLNIIENHTDKHRIGLDEEDATEWRIEMPTVKIKDATGDVIRLAADTLKRETKIYFYDATGALHETQIIDPKDDDYYPNTELQICTYVLKNTDNNEYLDGKNGSESVGNAYYVCNEDKMTATRIAFKKVGETVRLVPVEGYYEWWNYGYQYLTYDWMRDFFVCEEGDYATYTAALGFTGRKIIGGTTAESGVLKDEPLYKATSNDLFVVNVKEAPTYKKMEQGDKIILSLKNNTENVLVEGPIGGFATISNREAHKDLNPTLYVDTAYVNRAGNYAYQYLLGVRINRVDTTYKCTEPSHGTHRADTTFGYFLVNMIDSAKACTDVHNNKFEYNGEHKLDFVKGYHTNDTLFFTNDADEVISSMKIGDASYNMAKFAFKMIDEYANEFVIETGDGYDKQVIKKDGKETTVTNVVTTPSYLRWVNGNLVVTSDINEAAHFTMEASDKEATANEAISAGNVVVAGTNGAVVVKGAEGKNVIVSTILGKVVANEVVSSDNAQISAPAGIVVVSVDGESFKVVVK